MAHFHELHPKISLSNIWFFQEQEGPVNVFGCSPIVTDCEGPLIIEQDLESQK